MNNKRTVEDLVAEFKAKRAVVDEWERKHPGLKQISPELKEEYEKVKECHEYVDTFDVYYEIGDPVFDTGLRWGIPYLFDVEKYRGVVDYTRLTDDKLQSMSLTGSVYAVYDTTLNYCLGLWSHVGCEGVDTGSHDDFLCFGGDSDDNAREFETWVRAVAACVIGVDREAVGKMIEWRKEQIDSIREEIGCLEAILKRKQKVRAEDVRLSEEARIECGLSKCCDTCCNHGKIICLPPAEAEKCPDYEFDVLLALEKHQHEEFVRVLEENGADRRIARALADHYLGGKFKDPADGEE